MTGSTAPTSSTGKFKVLIVDDHPIVRHGLAQLINQQIDMEVCDEAESSTEALEKIAQHKPDIAVIDISIKGISGIELTKQIRSESKMPILVVSIHDESLYAERALRAGANGYLMKQEATDMLLSALRRILAGETHLSPNMGDRLLRKYVNGQGEAFFSPITRLSDRELEIFRHIGLGHGTRDIANELGLSIKTVESHRAHIKQKLKLKSAVELVHHAVQWAQNEGKPA